MALSTLLECVEDIIGFLSNSREIALSVKEKKQRERQPVSRPELYSVLSVLERTISGNLLNDWN